MLDNEPITLTVAQLKELYKVAYDDGRGAKLVCGGLSTMQEVPNNVLAVAIYKALTTKN